MPDLKFYQILNICKKIISQKNFPYNHRIDESRICETEIEVI